GAAAAFRRPRRRSLGRPWARPAQPWPTHARTAVDPTRAFIADARPDRGGPDLRILDRRTPGSRWVRPAQRWPTLDRIAVQPTRVSLADARQNGGAFDPRIHCRRAPELRCAG